MGSVTNNWQPFETAPKDGTRILVFYSGFMEIGWLVDKELFLVRSRDNDACRSVDLKPATHWQPLPEPPKIKRYREPVLPADRNKTVEVREPNGNWIQGRLRGWRASMFNWIAWSAEKGELAYQECRIEVTDED